MLPWFFACAASAALLFALFSLWRSLRAVLSSSQGAGVFYTLESERRESLSDEKAALLRSIRDLEFERQMDKISEEDFRRLDHVYRLRARDVLRLLDDEIHPYMAEAERLIGGQARSAADPQARQCAKCNTINDNDAAFCKKCAHPFPAGGP